MSERRKINKLHPDYEKYVDQCRDVQKRMSEDTEKVEYRGGKDGPLADMHKKYFAELKALQKQYSYLFEKVSGSDD